MRKSAPPRYLTTQRVEAFSDGVFAIAITLLILEIRVPQVHTDVTAPGLGWALFRLWPSYFGYVFSFVMIGIYWANHHYIFSLYQESDHYFVLLNVLFLMCISFLPFPTAVLAAYINDAEQRQPAVSLYTFALLLPAMSWTLMWLYASRRHRLMESNLDPTFIARLTRQYCITNLLYSCAFLLSFWFSKLSLIFCVGLSMLYLLPPRRPVYVKGDGAKGPADGVTR
ncbi:MAG TPA: TMEM175 family protein [Blastocatellia bacterium]|nr:TMEM175 family protein [Blastocatellia bacterium]